MMMTKRSSIAMACAVSMPSFGSALLMKPSSDAPAATEGGALPKRQVKRVAFKNDEKAVILETVENWLRENRQNTDDEFAYYEKLSWSYRSLREEEMTTVENNRKSFMDTPNHLRKKLIDMRIRSLSRTLSQIYEEDKDESKESSKFAAFMVMFHTWNKTDPNKLEEPEAEANLMELHKNVLWAPPLPAGWGENVEEAKTLDVEP